MFGWPNLTGDAIQRLQAANALANTQPGETPAYQLKPWVNTFACPACQVGETNAKVADYFTAWTCWACGDDQGTLPRPKNRPEPAADEDVAHRSVNPNTSLT